MPKRAEKYLLIKLGGFEVSNFDTEKCSRLFEDFKATLIEQSETDVTVLQWKKENTIIHSIKYIMSGNKLFITGDVGSAIFCLTWSAKDLNSYKGIDAHYFHSKLLAYSDEKYDFDEKLAIDRLNEEISEIQENIENWEAEMFSTYINQIKLLRKMKNEIRMKVTSCSELRQYLGELCSEYSEYDEACSEWLLNIGRVIPERIKFHLLGLQMAIDQLGIENE